MDLYFFTYEKELIIEKTINLCLEILTFRSFLMILSLIFIIKNSINSKFKV